MRRFLDRLASLPIIFISGACEAQMVMTPCELPIAAMAPVHFHPHPVKRHVAHRGGRRGVMHALHLVSGTTMCAVWSEGLDNGSLDDAFARDFGGGSPWSGAGGWDSGGSDWANVGVGGSEAGGGGSDAAPVFLVDAPALPPIGPIIPPPDCCGPTPTPAPLPTPVPEPSTWILMLAGFAALALYRWRRAHV